LLLEQVAEAGTEEVVVVDEEDAQPLLVGFLGRCGFAQLCLLGFGGASLLEA